MRKRRFLEDLPEIPEGLLDADGAAELLAMPRGMFLILVQQQKLVPPVSRFQRFPDGRWSRLERPLWSAKALAAAGATMLLGQVARELDQQRPHGRFHFRISQERN